MPQPSNFTSQEQGFSPQPPANPGPLPPNQGMWNIPHFATFAAVMNYASRSYRWTFDEAMRDNRDNALAMRRDPIIMSALRDRQTPTCQLDWQLEPQDKTDPRQMECATKITAILKRIPRFQQLKRSLLEALFYGRYGAQLTYEWDYSGGERQLVVKDWYPVNGDKIVFKYDGTPGILVNTAFFQGEAISTERGLTHFLTPDELECFMVHEFEPEDADFYEGILAGAVHGVGFRGRLYWFWWLRNNLTQIVMDFLQKVGTGITIFWYEAGNDASKQEVADAAESQIGNNVFLFPRAKDGTSAYAGPGIERTEVSMQGAEVLINLFNLLNGILRDYIMGETLTTDTAGTGMGSGVAEAHESTAERRTKYDAVDLDHTMQHLVDVLNRWNCPGNPTPHFHHLVDKPNVAEFMEAAKFGYEMGMSLDEDDTREKLGLPAPEKGHSILSKVGAMQPAAVNSLPPQGVPVADNQLPAPDGQEPQPIQGEPVQEQVPQQEDPQQQPMPMQPMPPPPGSIGSA